MKVYDFIFSNLINNETKIIIGKLYDDRFVCSGHWYNDNILKYIHRDVGIFHWDAANVVTIDIKPEKKPEIRRC